MSSLASIMCDRRHTHAFQVGRDNIIQWGRELKRSCPDPVRRADMVSSVALEKATLLATAFQIVYLDIPESKRDATDEALGVVYALVRLMGWMVRQLPVDNPPAPCVSFPVAFNPHLPVS